MIYQCEKCNEEVKLKKHAKICPYCGGALKPINITKKVAEMYTEGKKTKDIAVELSINDISVDQAIAKAAAQGLIPIDGIVQTEYEDDIEKIISGSWDGKLKTIKEQMPSTCSYTTINYYVEKHRDDRKGETRRKIPGAVQMIHEGKDIKEISQKAELPVPLIERLVTEEIGKNPSVAEFYIKPEHEKEVLAVTEQADYDGRLRTIKENVSDDITYNEIKSILAKNK